MSQGMLRLLILLSSFLLAPVDGTIKIVQDSNQRVIGKVGKSIVLKCRTNQHWEYCTWKHVSRGNTCNFEWKYSSGKVERTQCPSLWHKASFSGDYYKHECNMNISNLNERDFGQWTCIIEDYVLFGGRGAVVRGYVDLEKEEDFNTTSYKSLSTTTEAGYSGLSWGDLATTEKDKVRIHIEANSDLKTDAAMEEIYHKVIETPDGSSNAFIAVGVILGLMFFLFFLAIGVLYYRRRRKSEREFEWITNKKKNIPITEVVPDDQYDPEQNCLDINPATNSVKYIDTRHSSIIEPPELRLF